MATQAQPIDPGFDETSEQQAFRAEVRAWLADNAPRFERPKDRVWSEHEEVAGGRAWQRHLWDAGYAGIAVPKDLGGRGGTRADAQIFAEELEAYNIPSGVYLSIGFGMALPTIAKHGTQAQAKYFTERTLRGEMTWCQLFSEPGAGSDLAAVRTRGVRDGDDWIVNGQKVWSSWAHHADWGIILLRTDPKVLKHKGLSFFVIDMKSPGIDVRPIRQISGASDFNETFFTDVRLPDANRIGAEGEGWACAMTVLVGERLGNSGGRGASSVVAPLIALAGSTPRGSGTMLDNDAVRLSLAAAYAEEQASEHFGTLVWQRIQRGENPGAAPSVVKLAYSARLQRTNGIAMELSEMAGIAHDEDDAVMAHVWHEYIWSTALRIAGGADEVLRNQISERQLGMPSDFRRDKEVPFDQL